MKHLLRICLMALMATAMLIPSAASAAQIENWFGEPTPQQGSGHFNDTEEEQDCTGGQGVPAGAANIHWIFTADAATSAVFTFNGVEYQTDQHNENSSAWHFNTPFVDLDDITEAFVTFEGDGGENLGLRISHLCDGPDEPTVREIDPPTISKTASGQYTKTWTWDVTKDVTTARVVEVVPGGTATFGYEIKVTHSAADISAIRVRGVITVHNPTNYPIDIEVSDKLSNDLDCDILDDATVTIAAGDTLKFPYRCTLSEVNDELSNTGKVRWDGFTLPVNQDNVIIKLIAGSRTDTVAVGALEVNRVDECVLLDDTNAAGPQDVKICIGDENSEPTFTYTRTIPAPAEFGCFTYDNTATIVTNDTATEDSDSETVTVCRFRARLTPGYWKNHLEVAGPLLPVSLGDYVVNTTAKVTPVFAAMNCGSSTSQGAIGCLAGHLLATELNLKNSTNPCITPTRDAADAFLRTDLNSSVAGVQPYIGPSATYVLTAAQRTEAIALKTTLDVYNNGGGCILP